MTRKTTKEWRLERERLALRLVKLLETWEGSRAYWIEQTEHYAASSRPGTETVWLEYISRARGQVIDECIRELRVALDMPLQPVAAALKDPRSSQPDKKSEDASGR